MNKHLAIITRIGLVLLAGVALSLLLLLAGCAGKVTPAPRIPVARVITLPAERAALQVERTVRETQRTAQATVKSLDAASATAAQLFRVTPPDLQPLVGELTQQLVTAQRDAAESALQAEASAKAVAEMHTENAALGKSIEDGAKREAALADERDAARQAEHTAQLATIGEMKKTVAVTGELNSAQLLNGWLTLLAVILAAVIAAFVFRKPIARFAARFAGIPIP